MNNLYNWHDEQMIQLEMQQVRDEMEHVRMLKEAGISGNDWLLLAMKSLRGLLTKGWKRLQDYRSVEPQSQPSMCEKCVG